MRGIYLSMEPTDKELYAASITGLGVVGDYNRAFTDEIGASINFSIFGMNGELETPYSLMNIDMTMVTINPNIVYEIVGGEEKDIAGEIIKDGFSLSVFGGINATFMSMTSSQESIKSGRKETEYPMLTMMKGYDFGVVAEIPIRYWISAVPSYYLVKYMSMTMDGESVDGFESPMQHTFGVDFFVRPLKLNPNLKVSMGMLMGLLSANSEDESGYKTTMYVFGIQYEWGKHYSGLFLNPGITR